ncbi:hypothetical protein RHGRI_017836 [Rhododendron griersonianum]|uniref:Uncharacterized protein n=1 Tax=Rhododendron griersonianum TaxID=479676 RepID=A0AAV6JZA0_9ERIC|nr:hypothetical protein RHGRI_017836 [Rhododendron griersonianum]
MIDSQIKEHLTQSSYEDPFEACLSHFNDIDEDSTIESVNIFLESFIDISRLNSCFVEPPFSENTPSLWDEQESNFELKPLPPDPIVEIMGPTEIMSILVTPNNDQIEEEKIADENDHCNKELECDFAIVKLRPTGRTLLAILLFKNSFPWYADYVFHLNKVDIVTNFAERSSIELLIKSHNFHWAKPCIVNYKRRIRESDLVVIFHLAYICHWNNPQLFRLMLYDNGERLFGLSRFMHESDLGNAVQKKKKLFSLTYFCVVHFFFLSLCFQNLFCRCHTVQPYYAYEVYLTLYYFYVLV